MVQAVRQLQLGGQRRHDRPGFADSFENRVEGHSHHAHQDQDRDIQGVDAIQRFAATTMIGVPALYRMMLEHDRLDQYDLGSVDYWYSAGDVLPVEVGKRWQEKFKKPIAKSYLLMS